MPRVGVHCPVDGERIDDQACLSCKSGSPRPACGTSCIYSFEMLKGMLDSSGRTTAHVSATMLTSSCPRRTWLEQNTSWHANPQAMFPAWRGTMGHRMTEAHPEPGCIYEQRFETRLRIGKTTYKVTGQIDKLDIRRSAITDFKTKTDSKIKRLKEPQADHVMQLNVYRWLVSTGWPQKRFELDGRIYRPNEPANIVIDSLNLMYWSMETTKTMAAPIMELDEVAAWVEERVLGLQELPPIPDDLDPNRSKLCTDWCAVRDECLAREIGF